MSTQINLTIGNIFIDIEGELNSKQLKELERKLSFRPAGFQFSPMYNKHFTTANGRVGGRMWDGWKKQFWSGKKRTYFPTGLFSLATDYFKENDISFTWQDRRKKPEQTFLLERSENFTYRPYQQRVITDSCNRTRGIIQAATGAGKTLIASGIIKELKVCPFMFFVTSIDLLEQAKESLQKSLLYNGCNLSVGQIGGGVIDIRDVNVCTIQTAVRALGKQWDNKTKFDSSDTDDRTPIEKYKKQIIEVIQESKGSICDEVQHWRAETCQMVARELKSAYYTFGLSATPYRDEGDDMMIQACFGKKCAEITATELIEQGYLVRPNIKIVHFKERKSKFRQWQSLYKDRVVEDEYYNNSIANMANAFIDDGRLVLVLAQHISHGEKLSSLISGSQFLSGSSAKDHRKKGLVNLRTGNIRCIVASSIFDEGIDVCPLDTVILAGQGKSPVRAMQRIGRICRLYDGPNGKKTHATAVDPCIHDKYLLSHSISREKMYRTEPAYSIEHIGDD